MTNKEALDILKDRKIAYEVVITRTASYENRHMAEEELKLINACIIALEHKQFLDSAETVDVISIERLEQEIDRYIDLGLNSIAKELRTIIDEWRKENESNTDV